MENQKQRSMIRMHTNHKEIWWSTRQRASTQRRARYKVPEKGQGV